MNTFFCFYFISMLHANRCWSTSPINKTTSAVPKGLTKCILVYTKKSCAWPTMHTLFNKANAVLALGQRLYAKEGNHTCVPHLLAVKCFPFKRTSSDTSERFSTDWPIACAYLTGQLMLCYILVVEELTSICMNIHHWAPAANRQNLI